MNRSSKFQLHSPYGFRRDHFFKFFANLAFRLPRQPIKFRGLDKNGGGLLSNFCQTICNEITIKACFHFSIISQWKNQVAIAMKAHEQQE